MEINNIKCACCNNQTFTHKHFLPHFLFKKKSEIVVCEACQCGATYPSPTLSEEYYEHNENYDEVFVNKQEDYIQFAHDLLNILAVSTQTAGKSLLDIACGGGFLVRAAQERGYDAKGIDANRNMVKWASENGANVIQGDIANISVDDGSYDVIVLSHILEHLENPKELLKQCKNLLADDGVILVSQTDYKGLLPRLFPWGWYGWQPKEHYWHFTPKSFKIFANNTGFQVVKIERSSLYHPFVISGGLINFIGRNTAGILGRLGHVLGMDDGFNIQLSKSTSISNAENLGAGEKK